MTRPRLRSPTQPLVVRCALGLVEWAASLQLAVVVIALYAVLLAWATFLESDFGDKSRAANYAIYETWWFAGLNLLLGVNVLAAAAVRFPWKRSQTGFVIVHSGILLLLLGAMYTRVAGIDANLPVFEGQSQWRAFQNSEQFKLQIEGAGEPKTVHIPFVAGPFNWADRQRMFAFPWKLARMDKGVVYDRDGVRLEVLDYYSDASQVAVPQLALTAVAGGPPRGGSWEAAAGEELTLSVRGGSPHGFDRPYGAGRRKTTAGGTRIVFWMTGNREETEAFKSGGPVGPLGKLGQLVLRAGGKTHRLQVDELPVGKRTPLAGAGVEVELVQVDPRSMSAQLRLHGGTGAAREMLLLADFPEFSGHDYERGVFANYWFDPAARPKAESGGADRMSQMLREAHQPRIDILQGDDGKLYARHWQPPKAAAVSLLASDRPLTLGEGAAAVTLTVAEHRAAAKPGFEVVPLPFNRRKPAAEKQRHARVRLTVDGRAEEFWLAGAAAETDDAPLPPQQRKTVEGDNRRATLALLWDQIDVGFRIHLHEFTRKLDPGASAASYYASLVDFRDRHDPQTVLQKNVLITLNEPVNFSDPKTGRSFRLYQSSFGGPFVPGDAEFEQIVGGDDPREELFVSHFTANYDPGRGLKYVGSLAIVAGILVMFYMKSAFVKRRPPDKPRPSRPPAVDAELVAADR